MDVSKVLIRKISSKMNKVSFWATSVRFSDAQARRWQLTNTSRGYKLQIYSRRFMKWCTTSHGLYISKETVESIFKLNKKEIVK